MNNIHSFCETLSLNIKKKIKGLRVIPHLDIDQSFHCILINFIICLRHYDAIRLLCKNNYHEDAIAIKRCMFESVLSLRLFIKEDINTIKWIVFSGYSKKASRRFNVEEIRKDFTKNNIPHKYIEELFNIKYNKACLKYTWIGDKRQAAIDVNLEREYYRSYKYSHSFIHPSGVFMDRFIRYDIKNKCLYLLLEPYEPFENYISLLLLDSSLLLIKAVDAFNTKPKIFSVSRLERIDRALHKRLDLYIEKSKTKV